MSDPSKTPANRAVTYGCGCLAAMIVLFWVLLAVGYCSSPHPAG